MEKIPFKESIDGFELTKDQQVFEKNALIMEVDGQLKDLDHKIKKILK